MATTITNITQDTAQTQDFSVTDQRMTVFANVWVWNTVNNGVISNLPQSNLVNNGTIIGELGVLFSGGADFGRVTNNASGLISGEQSGVYLNGNHSALVNRGTIAGEQNGVGITALNTASVVNFGKIVSHEEALEFYSAGSAAISLNNKGVIHGAVGVYISTLSPHVTAVNAAGGLIKGTTAFYIDGGTLSLTNHGRVLGDIVDVAGLPTIVRNDGAMPGTLYLGVGNDIYNGTGGTSGKVYGQIGEDRLTGGPKADWLDGGTERDLLRGGPGGDRFHLGAINDSLPGTTLRDVVFDFNHGQHDRLHIGDLAATQFVFRGTNATFTGGGTPSVRYTIQNPAGTANDKTIVHGDYDGDGVTDFQVELRGVHNLVAGDFVL